MNIFYVGCGSSSGYTTSTSQGGSGGTGGGAGTSGDQPWVNPGAGPLVTQIQSDQLNGNNGFALHGNKANELAGRAVSFSQDFNGDGFSDILIGVPGEDNVLTPATSEGSAYLVLGGVTHPAHNSLLNSLNGQNGGFALNGGLANASAGLQVTTAGDFNGDDFWDLVIAAPSNVAGSTALVFGRQNLTSPLIQNLNLNLLNPASAGVAGTGLKISSSVALQSLGVFMEGGGDFNGDGLSDLWIGLPGLSQSYLLMGRAAGLSNVTLSPTMSVATAINFRITDAFDNMSAIGHAGDVDGDGFADFLVGIPGLFGGDDGRVILFFGSSNYSSLDNLDLSTVTSSSSAIVFVGPAGGGELGRDRVTGVGDLNSDGFADFAMVAPYTDPDGRVNAGSVYVVFGKSSRAALQAVNLSTLNGVNGFRADGGTNSAPTGYELQVSPAGDVNADGFDDLIVGDPGFTNAAGGGRVYLIYGRSSGFADLHGHNLNDGGLSGVLKINGVFSLGRNISKAGDLNGDGFDDLLLGAFQNTDQFFVTFGSVFIVYGGDFNQQLSVNATAGADKLVGLPSNNTINGWGGSDVIRAGAGDDTIYFYGDEKHIDGGGDKLLTLPNSLGDTLKLNTLNMNLDLTNQILNRILNIESIDMRGVGPNTLKLNIKKILGLSQSTNKLYVRGDNEDSIDLSAQNFVLISTKVVLGVSYNCYEKANYRAQLCIEPTLQIINN